MGWGKKKPAPEPEPVRPEQVKRLKKAMADESDATTFDVPGCPDYPRAKAIKDAVWRNSTPAEQEAASPGLRKYRNGGR